MNRRDFVQLASGSVALAAFQNNAIEKAQAASQSVTGRKPEEVARDGLKSAMPLLSTGM